MPDNDVDGNGEQNGSATAVKLEPQGLPVGPGGPLVPRVR